jgi:hypothetical protein
MILKVIKPALSYWQELTFILPITALLVQLIMHIRTFEADVVDFGSLAIAGVLLLTLIRNLTGGKRLVKPLGLVLTAFSAVMVGMALYYLGTTTYYVSNAVIMLLTAVFLVLTGWSMYQKGKKNTLATIPVRKS